MLSFHNIALEKHGYLYIFTVYIYTVTAIMDDLIRIENAYDHQTVAWLRERLGEQALCEVVLRMQGHGKPYASAVCRALGLVPPPRRHVSGIINRAVGEAYLASIRALLAGHRAGGHAAA
ncbi:hypothetical protein MAFF211271_35890 (plasmid) [Ralstonia syzygii subsp. indonesiensis]|nr:hypothetical protein MAFF211271_35890 [Ralstonia pseudosolanacearum]